MFYTDTIITYENRFLNLTEYPTRAYVGSFVIHLDTLIEQLDSVLRQIRKTLSNIGHRLSNLSRSILTFYFLANWLAYFGRQNVTQICPTISRVSFGRQENDYPSRWR